MASDEPLSDVVIGREPCPDCGSRDNLTRYADGHAYCFGATCKRFEPPDGEEHTPRKERKRMPADLIKVEYQALGRRSLSEDTCRRFGYGVGTFKGETVQAAPYRNQKGELVRQKLRFRDKKEGMPWVGEKDTLQLFGQHLWSGRGRKLIITEGELDAMSVSQVQDHKFAVVSLINGAHNAAKDLTNNLQFILGYEEIVLMFDMDEDGQAAVESACAVLPAGRAFVASLPRKDANDCLVAGEVGEIVKAIWGAKPYRPDGIVSVKDIAERAKKPVEIGLPWVYDSLTEATYGRRFGEIYAVGAGTGVGKTDFLTEQMAYDIRELKLTVGVIMLEQDPVETLQRLAGKVAGKRFHVPGAGWTQEELDATIDSLEGTADFYDSFGETAWEIVEQKIRFMAVSLGHKVIYLDHLTALADTSNEKESLEQIMKEMAGLAKELGIMIIFVSHLSRPKDGKPHEEGGRVMIGHFKGSSAIGFWSYFMFGLERAQQDQDEDKRKTTTFRILKDRYTGQATGKIFWLGYDTDRGRLYEKASPNEAEDEFKDETGSEEEGRGRDDF